jgi:hypothetical protein
MSQVIIFQNEQGGVSVCVPTGELPIEQVLAKDCPENAMIVDESALPQGDDANYFNAWVLNNGVVTVDATKKAEIIAKQQAEITAKESALSKLTALGLTADEVKALLGVA